VLDRNAVFKIKSDNFVSRNVEGETILVPLVSNVADMTGVLTLNEVASSVFDAIDGKNTINDILLQLIEAYDVEMEVLEQDVEQFIKAAQSKQLIDKIDN
jgi:hypothetical protein